MSKRSISIRVAPPKDFRLPPSTAWWIRAGLVLFFLLVLYEGALRKWMLPGYQRVIFVLKDAVLAGTLAIYWFNQDFNLPVPLGSKSALGIWLPLFIGWCALEALNFRLPNLILGLWGFKLHVLPISLILLIPAAFHSFDHLYKYVWWFLILSVPIFVVSFLQFTSPPSAFINKLVGEGAKVETFLGFVRVTGTFSYISAMKKFSFLAVFLALMIIFGERFRFSPWSLPMYIVVCLGAVVNPMVGAKWTAFAWGIAFVLIILMSRRLGTVIPEVTSFWRVAVLALVIGGATTIYAGGALEALQTRLTTETQNTKSRIVQRVAGPVRFLEEAGLFGFGVGSTYQAAYVLVNKSPQNWRPTDIEEAPERLMIELGAIGFIIQCGVYVSIVLLAVRIIYATAEPRRLVLALGALGFILTNLTEQVAFNTTVSSFFWGLVGILAFIANDMTTKSLH